MNRRDFLRTLGKGATIAGAKPAAVGKMLMNVSNTSTKNVSFFELFKNICRVTDLGGEGEPEYMEKLPYIGKIQYIKKTLQGMVSFLMKNGVYDSDTKNAYNKALKKLNDVELSKDIEAEFHYLMETDWDSDLNYNILKTGYLNNFISPEQEKFLMDHYMLDSKQHVLHRLKIKEREEKAKRSERGSRFDYAGSSEDEGYAKYFENYLKENYADGKNPGRKGLAKRSGVNCKQSVTKLRKVAKNSTGERRRMAHWCANMKSGKKKK
jgi:hypothetical protein